VIEDKGGIGVFTKARMKVAKDRKLSPQENLLERVVNLENSFAQLKELYSRHISEMESRAEFCRNQMLTQLKNALAAERKRNRQLAHEHGRLKEKYRQLLKYRR